MNELLENIFYLLNRYLHIVSMALLVGGTLFYEMMLPVAIADLKSEHQLAVVGRARWAFRWVVISCAAILLVSGVFSVYRNWNAYSGDERAMFGAVVSTARSVRIEGLAPWQNPRTWMLGHAVLGLIGLLIAVGLVIGQRPPDRPVRWMRRCLMILLVAIFLGSATRNARLRMMEMLGANSGSSSPVRLMLVPASEVEPSTQPANASLSPTTKASE